MDKNKKSQVASTMVWFIATIIIFFIMVLFLTASVLDSGRKKVVSGWDDIKLEKFNGNLNSQRALFNLLNMDFTLDNQTSKLKDWLIMDIYNMDAGKKAVLRERIREEVKKMVIANGGKNCYAFQALSGFNKDPEEMLRTTDPRGTSYVVNFIEKNSIQFGSYDADYIDPRGAGFVSEAQSKLLKKTTLVVLPRETRTNIFGVEEMDYQKVLVKFYIGAC